MQAIDEAHPWDELAQLLKILGHPIRLKIVAGLVTGACNVGKIWQCLELPQPTVSQHLKLLRQEGILRAERHGKEVTYQVVDARVKQLLDALEIDCRDVRLSA